MSKLFRIYEEDLAELEKLLPVAFDELAMTQPSPRARTMFRRIKEIISNVRWNYGPPEQVERIDP